jgi:ABC-type dipeptide/oligopeptide/nickel transport system permease subunit
LLLIGALSGYYGGWVDTILMRLVDIFISVPGLFVLILVSTVLQQQQADHRDELLPQQRLADPAVRHRGAQLDRISA